MSITRTESLLLRVRTHVNGETRESLHRAGFHDWEIDRQIRYNHLHEHTDGRIRYVRQRRGKRMSSFSGFIVKHATRDVCTRCGQLIVQGDFARYVEDDDGKRLIHADKPLGSGGRARAWNNNRFTEAPKGRTS